MIFRRKQMPKLAISAPVLPPQPPQLAPNGKKILLVDDDAVVLGALSLKLRSKGYQVVTARDGSEALAATRNERPDLMVLDVELAPDVGGVDWNGFLLTDWLRRTEEARDIPVFIMSAAGRAEYKQRAASVGANAFFPKPASHELFASIDCALAGKSDSEKGKPTHGFDI